MPLRRASIFARGEGIVDPQAATSEDAHRAAAPLRSSTTSP